MEINLHKCSLNDFKSFYFLKCDEKNIYWTGHKSKPKKEILKNWFVEQLERKDRIVFLVRTNINNEVVGYLYLDIVGEKKNIIEIGYGVYSEFNRQGIGTQIIKLSSEYIKNNLKFIDEVNSWVLDTNIASIKVMLKNEYLKTDEIKNIFMESISKKEVMRKYIYRIER